MPDALSKTIPIWCVVVNRAIKIVHHKKEDWNVSLYCPPGVVSAQEYSQIESQLDTWTTSLSVSRFDRYLSTVLTSYRFRSNPPIAYQTYHSH